ncbi:MAG: hypothetical protein Q8928_08840 [Bacteroidota bacterium]|nr:hypothetical protein [Bacteroidota bacterium]
MKKYFNIAFFTIVIYLSFSCTQKNDNIPESTGQLYFHLHANIDNSEVTSYNSVIQSANGRKISLSLAQMYISHIELVKLDGSLYPVSGKVLLKDLENEDYLVGNVPAGNYRSVHFSVGLDSVSNTRTPVASDTVFNRPEMWFASTAQPQGYVFLNVQGKIDTTAKANGSLAQMIPFVYKIGSNKNIKKVIMPDYIFTVLPNHQGYVHLLINYMRIFDGIDIRKADNLSVQTMSDNSNTVTQQIVNNIPGMFRYE